MLKSIVATLGNNLVKRGISRPHAFQKAWRMARQSKFFAKAVAVTVGSRQEALKRLAQYGRELVRVYLVHEGNNPVDPNAVAVVVAVAGKGQYKAGYLAKEGASLLARVIDKLGGQLAATLENITGGGDRKYGLNISYALGAGCSVR